MFSPKNKNMKVLLIFGVLVLISVSTNAKTFTKCELAKKLHSSGISKASLPDCKIFFF